MKFNYKDLLTSVKFHVTGSAVAFSRLSYERTFAIGMALLRAILLQIFQSKMRIPPPVGLVRLTKHLRILKKMSFICNNEYIIDNNAYNKGDIRRPEINLE